MPRYVVDVPDYLELDEVDVIEILEEALDEADVPAAVYDYEE